MHLAGPARAGGIATGPGLACMRVWLCLFRCPEWPAQQSCTGKVVGPGCACQRPPQNQTTCRLSSQDGAAGLLGASRCCLGLCLRPAPETLGCAALLPAHSAEVPYLLAARARRPGLWHRRRCRLRPSLPCPRWCPNRGLRSREGLGAVDGAQATTQAAAQAAAEWAGVSLLCAGRTWAARCALPAEAPEPGGTRRLQQQLGSQPPHSQCTGDSLQRLLPPASTAFAQRRQECMLWSNTVRAGVAWPWLRGKQ